MFVTLLDALHPVWYFRKTKEVKSSKCTEYNKTSGSSTQEGEDHFRTNRLYLETGRQSRVRNQKGFGGREEKHPRNSLDGGSYQVYYYVTVYYTLLWLPIVLYSYNLGIIRWMENIDTPINEVSWGKARS